MALLLANHSGEVDNLSLREVTGQHPADVTKVLTSLRSRGFFEMIGAGRGTKYRIAPHLLPATTTAAVTHETNFTDGDSNSKGIDSNSKGIDSNSKGIDSNSKGIDSNSKGIDSNSKGIDSTERPTENRILWERLESVAEPIRLLRKPDPEDRNATIIQLCRLAALSTAELAVLLNRDAVYLRQRILSDMIGGGLLIYLYPETPNHPRQRYLAPDHGKDNELA